MGKVQALLATLDKQPGQPARNPNHEKVRLWTERQEKDGFRADGSKVDWERTIYVSKGISDEKLKELTDMLFPRFTPERCCHMEREFHEFHKRKVHIFIYEKDWNGDKELASHDIELQEDNHFTEHIKTAFEEAFGIVYDPRFCDWKVEDESP